jgi:hypothetical protein
VDVARWRRLPGAAADLLSFVALTGFAGWALGFLLVDDLYIFADNPGTYTRLWWLIEQAGPGGLLGWNPWWYAGWPEWQFYPPGYGLAGLALAALSGGHLSSVQVYQVLLFGAYLLPALVAFLALRGLGLGRAVGLTAGFFLLVFPDLYGGVGGVLIGMLGDRPALGLVPLAWWLGVRVASGRTPALSLAGLALTAAAIVLLHPFRLWLAALLVLLSVLLLPGVARWRALVACASAGLLGLALAAFWLVPYLAQSSLATPVLRASLETLPFWLFGGRLGFFLVFAAWGMVRAVVAPPRERALLLALALAAGLTLLWMLADWLILVDRLGVVALDPIRFIEDVYLAVLLLAAAGFVDLLRLAYARVGSGWGVVAAVVATALLALLVFQPFPGWVNGYRPTPGGEPRFLREATAAYQLDRLWATLRASPGGRVLFTSSVFRLRQAGGNVPTYLMALTPALAGRETIGGTFQHWAPVAAFYWYGLPLPRVMAERTDLKDDQTIFGLPWRGMDEARLLAILRALNVTEVVATEYDVWARTFLDRSPAFEAVLRERQFNVYRVRDYLPTLVEGEGASARAEASGGTVRIWVEQAAPGASLLLKQSYAPRWVAEAPAGPVSLEPDAMGLTRLRLPAGARYEVVLRYLPGPAERLGLATSLAALVVVLVLVGGSLVVAGRRLSRVSAAPERVPTPVLERR